MNSKMLKPAVCAFSLLLLVAGGSALAQDHGTVQFTGLINDYVPQNPNISGSPYEMHGQWTLDVHPQSNTADFSADMTMSGFGMTSTGAVDPTQPLMDPHTHHIKLTNASITADMTGCPPYLPPATVTGVQINGTVSLLTGNGNVAPFETNPPSSTLQVCITGGNETTYSTVNSNLTMVFGGPALKHFGSGTIHGVVSNPLGDVIRKGR